MPEYELFYWPITGLGEPIRCQYMRKMRRIRFWCKADFHHRWHSLQGASFELTAASVGCCSQGACSGHYAEE